MRQRHRRRQGVLNASVAAYERGELTPEAVSALKLHTTEVFSRVADACLQLFGGYGYMAEYPISRFLDRCARAAHLRRHLGDHERAGGAFAAGALTNRAVELPPVTRF